MEKSEYENLLKISSRKIITIDYGELNQQIFYDIMSKNSPYIAQRILERKNKKNNSTENKAIIE